MLAIDCPNGVSAAIVPTVTDEPSQLDLDPLSSESTAASFGVHLCSFSFGCVQAAEKEAREKAAGLRKETISPGDGKTRPQPGDQLAMHYTGKLAAKWCGRFEPT